MGVGIQAAIFLRAVQDIRRGNQIIKLRASPAKATMELPFAQNYAASTSELLLSPHRLTAVY
jgi:hypothetical protein